MTIEVFRLLFLQMPAIGQQDAAEISGCMTCINWRAQAVANQQWKIAAVIEMGVGENGGVNRIRAHRKWCPVSEPQYFVTLKQSAVDEEPALVVVENIAGAGNGACSACEGEFHFSLLNMTTISCRISE